MDVLLRSQFCDLSPTKTSNKEGPPTQEGGSDVGQLVIPIYANIKVPEYVAEALHPLPQMVISKFFPCTPRSAEIGLRAVPKADPSCPSPLEQLISKDGSH